MRDTSSSSYRKFGRNCSLSWSYCTISFTLLDDNKPRTTFILNINGVVTIDSAAVIKFYDDEMVEVEAVEGCTLHHRFLVVVNLLTD